VATGPGITAGTGDLGAGSVVTLTVNLSEAVAVTSGGTPTLSLNDNGTATYDAAKSTSTALAFDYTVAAGQDTPALAVTAVNLNGASVTNSIPVTVTGGSGQSLTDPQGNVWSFGAADIYGYAILRDGVQYAGGAGETLALDTNGVIWTENNLNNWYMVVPTGWTGEASGPMLSSGAGAQTADLTGAVTPLAGPLQIDTTTPTVTQVVSSVATGEVITGQAVRITLDTNEAVTVSGTPVLLLNDGGTASYDAVDSTATALAFNYNVTSEVTTDLVVSGMQLPLTSSIADLAGNNANLAGAGANLGLQVNTTRAGAAGPSGGNFTISGGTQLELFGAATADAAFAPGDTGTLRLDASSQFSGTVAGLALGNSLDLADIAFGNSTRLGYTPNGHDTGGTLTATDGTHIADIGLLGQYMAASFVAANDGHGGTLITDPPLSQPQTLTQSHA
jgi:hypothetical protein